VKKTTNKIIKDWIVAILVFIWIAGFFLLNMFTDISTSPLRILFILIISAVLFYLMIIKRIKISKVEKGVFIYCLVGIIALFLINISAIESTYSSARSTLAFILFFFTYVIVSNLTKYLNASKKYVFSKIHLLLIFFFVLVLFLGISSIAYRGGIGGIRLTAGVNANSIGFLSAVVLLWLHLSSLIGLSWHKLEKILYGLAFIVMLWSLSRGAIGMMFIFYGIYFLIGFIPQINKLLLTLKLNNRLAKFAIVIILIPFFMLLIWETLSTMINAINYLATRFDFGGDTNISSRELAWGEMIEYFYVNPLTGGIGWYNATNILSDLDHEGASSPHGLYIKLLGEIGILGAIFVLTLPLVAIITTFLNVLRNVTFTTKVKSYSLLLFASLIALFSREIIEDSYMVSYVNIQTSFVIFIICLFFNKNNFNKNSKLVGRG